MQSVPGTSVFLLLLVNRLAHGLVAPIVQNTTELPTLTITPLSFTGGPLSIPTVASIWPIRTPVELESETYLLEIASVTSPPESLVTDTASHEVTNTPASASETTFFSPSHISAAESQTSHSPAAYSSADSLVDDPPITSKTVSLVTNAPNHPITNPPASTLETTSIAPSLTSTAVVTPDLAPAVRVVVASGASISQGAPPVVIDGTTNFVPGHTPTIVGDETIVLSSSVLFVGTNTKVLPTSTLGSPVPTNPSVVGGVTFSVSSLASPIITGSPLIVGGATVSYMPSASDVVVGTQTILLGSAVTISGTPISFGSSDLVVGATTGSISLETIAIPTAPPSSSGLGGLILSMFNGVPSSTPTTAGGIDMKPFVGSASRLQHDIIMIICVVLLGFSVGFLTMM